jgi:hypothetical protein
LLHRQHRDVCGDNDDMIWAEFADYKAVRELMIDTMSESAEVKARKTLPETVEAVGRACRDNERETNSATVNEIAAALSLDRSVTKRRLDHAIRAGHVALLDARHGRSFLYTKTGAAIGPDTKLLPTVEEVELAYKRRKERKLQSSSPAPPKILHRLHS